MVPELLDAVWIRLWLFQGWWLQNKGYVARARDC